MKVLKKSQQKSPKVSLILLDWGVRESFHLLHYLSEQNIDRSHFEVVIIEYYSGVSTAIQKFEEQVDSWVLLEMPENAYYHKHLMYNAGIIMSQGEYVIICDSDAMAKPTFIGSVLNEFNSNPDIVLHIDQFRNNRKDLYPFKYPSFEEVTGRGCINYKDGKTTGMAVTEDIIHNRNYGACFCARRDLLIEIGGADEHIDFIGHICGPYDLTFRLINAGCKEIWHEHEFLYHTWHPGQAGENNYLGPHDGRHMSTTSLEALYNLRIQPHVENPLITKLRQGEEITDLDLQEKLILPEYNKITEFEFLSGPKCREWADATYKYISYNGYNIIRHANRFYAISRFAYDKNMNSMQLEKDANYKASSLELLKTKIDEHQSYKLRTIQKITALYMLLARIKNIIIRQTPRVLSSIKRKISSIIKTAIKPINKIIITPLRNTYRFQNRVINKLRSTHDEHKFYWDNMRSLLASIKLALQKHNSVTLLISSGNESTFLFIAKKLKLLPKKLNIIKYNHENEVKQYIDNIPTDTSGVVLLSRQLYIDSGLYFEGVISGKKLYIV